MVTSSGRNATQDVRFFVIIDMEKVVQGLILSLTVKEPVSAFYLFESVSSNDRSVVHFQYPSLVRTRVVFK